MRALITVGLVLIALAAPAVAVSFDQYFNDRTMRVDIYHTGTASLEHWALDRVRVEGPWPGSRTQLLDTTNLGKYRFEVVDIASQRVIYSRGFASIFGEWETTGEAVREFVRTIPEALRFPEPKQPVQVRVYKRGADQMFQPVWTLPVDPSSRFVDRAAVASHVVGAVLESGPPAEKVDLVILGDGYTAAEMDKYHADARLAFEDLFSHEPFASRKSDFNVWTVDAPATETGISRPRSGIFRDSPLGARYNSFDSERYILTLDDRAWRDVAAAAPYDFVLILVNSEKYGGGGIFNLYSTAAVDSGFRRYLVVHEFGHHFAGLGDEYYTSSVAYEDFHGEQIEPWEPNITALADPAALKWGDLVEEATPLPTPWEKEAYEEYSLAYQERRSRMREEGVPESKMEELFEEARRHFTETLGRERYAGKIGAFEGAGYQAEGLYRPRVDCIMFTRDEVGFCQVCARAIERIIDLYSR